MANTITVQGKVGLFDFSVTGTNANKVVKDVGKLLNGIVPPIRYGSNKPIKQGE